MARRSSVAFAIESVSQLNTQNTKASVISKEPNHKATSLWSKVQLNVAQDFEPAGNASSKAENDMLAPKRPTFVSFSQEEWPVLLLSLLIQVAGQLCDIAKPLVVAALFDDVIAQAAGKLDGSKSQIEWNTFIPLVTVLFALNALVALTRLVGGSALGVCGERVVARIRIRLYGHLLKQEMGYFDQSSTGDLISTLGSDTMLLQSACTDGLVGFIQGVLNFIFTTIAMFIAAWSMALIEFGSMASLLLFVMLPMIRFIKRSTTNYQERLGHAAGFANEALGSMKTVRSFSAEKIEEKRYEVTIGLPNGCSSLGDDTVFAHGCKREILEASMVATALFIADCGYVGWLAWGLRQVMLGDPHFTIGLLISFQVYHYQLLSSTGKLIGATVAFANAIGGSKRIVNLLCRVPAIRDAHVGELPAPCAGVIRLRQVYFAYATRPRNEVLRNVSIYIPANTSCAMVGASGCGKSSSIALIMRFYDVERGTVSIDGHDVKRVSMKWLRTNVGFVQQEPVLFSMSLRENLCYGLCAATGIASTAELIDEVKFINATRQANCYDFICGFPEGFDTIVAGGGVGLSGGQKQRIAIARTLMLSPRILLFDEATSALDTESEQMVQRAIDTLRIGRTVVLIAHRMSTIRDCDQITVFHKGHVLDRGGHDLLLSRCDAYQKLIHAQELKHNDFEEVENTHSGEGIPDEALLPEELMHELPLGITNAATTRRSHLDDEVAATSSPPPSARGERLVATRASNCKHTLSSTSPTNDVKLKRLCEDEQRDEAVPLSRRVMEVVGNVTSRMSAVFDHSPISETEAKEEMEEAEQVGTNFASRGQQGGGEGSRKHSVI